MFLHAMLNNVKCRLFVDLHFIISLNSFVDFLYVPSFVRGGREVNLLRSIGQPGGCRPMGRHSDLSHDLLLSCWINHHP